MQHIPELEPDPIPDWMLQNHNEDHDMIAQQLIDNAHDARTRKSRAQWIAIAGLFLAVVFAFCVSAAYAQAAPTFTASVTQGPAPLSTTLTWNVPGATACTAGSTPGWNGPVAASGTKTLTSIGVDMTLTLNCTGPGKALLSWTHNGKNTDGSAVTLAGFTVLYGPSATQLTQTVLVDVPGATAYTVDSLAAGSYAFAVKARSASGAESVNSNVATKAVAGVTYSGSVAIDVTSIPSAPSGVVVTEVTAIDVRQNADGTLYAVNAPMVPLSTRCAGNDCTVLTRRAP